jgi:chemotaxis protein methyltransferase CheR
MTFAPATDTLSANDFAVVSRFVEANAAITLAPGKEYLVQSRLAPLARDLGFASIGDLVRRIEVPGDVKVREAVVDAMTTNETLWFRDITPWQALQQHVIPEIMERRRGTRDFGVWCGASSSGQEPFTLSMLMSDHFPELATWRRTLVGTDISPSMLARCKSGVYSSLEVNRGLPAMLLVRHFDKQGPDFQVRRELRDIWDFRQLNLSQPFPPLPRADLVMLRNVLIYFNDDVKRDVLAKVRRVMDPDGWLFLGSAETPLALDDNFERVPVGATAAFRLKNRPSKK